ncbi:MAG: LysR family transcriptional regulator [Desulfovibrionaceae bacterium]|jgi:DNA-binding transcriptional LysR family regulator|nr:LysR family transcriptional regulator [Desulfovibrionaceae bacterium]
MHLEHLRAADLNLLVVFMALAEERSVSRAADRLARSQPAVSRALQRLRHMLGDALLVRTGGGYELTPTGRRLFDELGGMLPRLDRLVGGAAFDPMAEAAHFTITLTDNAAAVLVPTFCRRVLPTAARATFHFRAWHEQGYEDLLHGRVDLVLNADDGHAPPACRTQTVYEDRFVCVVAAESPYGRRLSMAEYSAARHIGVSVLQGVQTIPQAQLAQAGVRRRCALHVPYFTIALRSVEGTDLVATVPRRMALRECANPALRILEPPEELRPFRYLMVWHPRVESDSAHRWLREAVLRVGRLAAGQET